MGLTLLTERHATQIGGVLSCYDRVIVQGTLPVFCYAEGMTAYLTKRRIRIFDFVQFTKPLTDAIKANAEELAAANGLKSPASPTSYGSTKKKSSPACGRTMASVSTTISTSWMRNWGCAMCGYPPGPFRLQFYCHGHNWLARQLDRQKIRYTLLDNAFTAISDWEAAQELADRWDASRLHRRLDEFAEVEQRNGEAAMKFAPMKRTIYSLGPLREVRLAANRRYLEFLSAIDDHSNGIDELHKITRPVQEDARSYRGFNFFDQDDEAHLLALARGEFTISGVQNKALRIRFPQYNSGQMSRILRRLRTHELIKKARHCYKYYLTVLGKNLTT